VSYYQSILGLTLLRKFSSKKAPAGKLLVIADPVFNEQDERYKAAQADDKKDRQKKTTYVKLMNALSQAGGNAAGVPRLPLTADLAEGLSEMYARQAETITGLKASKKEFLGEIAPRLHEYDRIVFATHGYLGNDLPGVMEPALVLSLVPRGTDGLLRMKEVLGLKAPSELVVLTACQSGLGEKVSGEGIMGMGRAFQYAGSKSVLMSLWSVDELASVKLVHFFFQSLKKGSTKLEALQEARLRVREAGFDHPFFWASFVLAGEAN
jgi:CHAT domain-containing protein